MKGRIYKTIPAELVSAAEGGVVVSADGVYDYLLEKNLETINNEKANTSDLAAIAFSGSYSDLSDTPVIPEIPHNVSSFDNDVGYLTQHLPLKTINGKNLVGTGNIEIIGGGNFEPWMQSDWNLTDDSAVNYIKNKPSIPTIPSNISAFNNDVGYLTLHLDISGKADKSTLARVATTGSYNDLANTPITPTITVLSVTGGYLITIIDENNPSGLSFTITNGTNGSNGVNGTDGVDGTNGADGQDGVSPVVTIASITGGHSVTITDAEHLNGQTFNVMDGANGTNGINGTNGLDGITPHIDATTKHWMIGTIDTGVIAEGQNGLDGANGTNGTNGTDGVTPHIDSTTGNWFIGTADTGVHAQGPAGQDGLNGSNGTNGTNGTDGISPAVTIATISGGHSVTITDADHPSGQSFNVMDGTLANQIQADWNQTSDSAADYIKNKPTIPAEVTETTVTNWGFTKNTGNSNFSGSYNDLTDKPTIPSLAGYATETWVGQLGFLTLHLSLTNYILKSLTTGLLKNDGTVDENTYLTLHQSLTNYIQKNQTAGLVKNDGTIDTNTYLTLHQSLTDYALKSELFSGSYDDLSNKPTIPTNVSSLTNDANYITGMVILSYGSSTWNDFISAYNANKVVYCRASSNSNPASGSQTRLAFMAYVNNATSPTEVEFLYYRSVLTHSDNQLGDQVFVYKLVSNGTWTVTTRNTFIKIVAGTNMTSSYSNGALTLNASTPDLTSYATESWVLQLGYLTSHLDISGKANSADLATIATTGSYTDLSNTPTIPTVPTTLSSFTDDLGSSPTHTHSLYLTQHLSASEIATSLGTLLNSGQNLTTITMIPTLNRNTLGASSISTLASVLGGSYQGDIGGSNGAIDLNDVTKYGAYCIGLGADWDNVSNRPENEMNAGTLFVMQGSSETWRMQIIISQGGKAYYRNIYVPGAQYNTSWVRFSTDIPDFYKDYITIAALRNGVATVGGGGIHSVAIDLTDTSASNYPLNGVTYFTNNAVYITGKPSSLTSSASCIVRVYAMDAGGFIEQTIQELQGRGRTYVRDVPPNKLTDASTWIEIDQSVIPSFYKNYGTLSALANALGAVTSSTSGLKIEVVSSLPATPDSNTIYIVQSA